MWLWTSKEWGWISTQTLQSWRPFDLQVQLQSSHLFHNGFPISNFFLFKGKKKKHTIKHLINIREYFHDIYFSQQITILLIQKKYPTTLLFLISAIIHHNSSKTAVSFLCVSNIPQEKMLTIKEYSQWSLSVYNQISHWEARTLHN